MVTGDSAQFITGRGKHSAGGVSKLKLAVEDYVRTRAKDFSFSVELGFVTVTKK